MYKTNYAKKKFESTPNNLKRFISYLFYKCFQTIDSTKKKKILSFFFVIEFRFKESKIMKLSNYCCEKTNSIYIHI